MANDEWYTPSWLLERAQLFWDGPPDFDPASCEVANEVVGATRYLTQEDDGLQTPWPGGALRVWMNPPYSKVRPWTQAAADFTQAHPESSLLALIPASITTQWFHDTVFDAPTARVMLVFRGRIAFRDSEGQIQPHPRHQNVLIHYGPEHLTQRFDRAFGAKGRVVGLS